MRHEVGPIGMPPPGRPPRPNLLRRLGRWNRATLFLVLLAVLGGPTMVIGYLRDLAGVSPAVRMEQEREIQNMLAQLDRISAEAISLGQQIYELSPFIDPLMPGSSPADPAFQAWLSVREFRGLDAEEFARQRSRVRANPYSKELLTEARIWIASRRERLALITSDLEYVRANVHP